VRKSDRIVSVASLAALAVSVSLLTSQSVAEARRGETPPAFCVEYPGGGGPYGCLYIAAETAAVIATDYVCDEEHVGLDCLTCKEAALFETCDFSTAPGWKLDEGEGNK
jgi:hypothetical protein